MGWKIRFWGEEPKKSRDPLPIPTHNTADTPVEEIQRQLHERRPLPTGRQEFEEWSDRIIAGAMLTATPRSQKFALADMLLHLGPTESYKEDAFFIHALRKSAVNQVADAMRKEIRDAAKAEYEKEEQANKLKVVDFKPSPDETKVLADQPVQST